MNKILGRTWAMCTNESATWLWLVVPTALALLLIITQHTNIGFLQIYSIDEYAFYGSLHHMYESLVTGNLSGLFGYGFYQYGFVYFFINLVAALPGLISHQSWITILAPRIITSLFALGSLIVVYHFARLYLKKKTSLLFATFVMTMPAFWYNATWFHPDWVMTFFILCFLYCLARDSGNFKKPFYLGVICYALAIAMKYQAITFAPVLVGYIFYDAVRNLTVTGAQGQLRTLAISLASIMGIFLVLNPYIIHPMGWRAFSTSFVGNMLSNATNHGSSAIVTISDKITLAVGDYYLNILFFFLLNLAALWLLVVFFKEKKRSLFVIIAANYLVNITYLFLFVGKAWQVYYLPVITTGLCIAVYYLQILAPKRQVRYIQVAIAIQILCYMTSYYPLLFTSRDSTAPDYITYSKTEQHAMNSFIVDTLTPVVTPDSIVLLSAYTPLHFEKLGIPYEQVEIIFGAITLDSFDLETYIAGQRGYWGSLKTDDELARSFKPVDVIVLRKDVPYIDTRRITAARNSESYLAGSTIVRDLYAGKYNFTLLAEDDTVVIFSRTSR